MTLPLSGYQCDRGESGADGKWYAYLIETIKLDRDQLVHASPERLKELLAAHGIENGEVIKIEFMGDKVVLFVAVHSYSSSSAAIEEVDGVLLARTSIVGNPDSVVQADRDERLFHLMNW